MSRYISVDDLQSYCDNQRDHSITPNEFQRMDSIRIVRCKDCKYGKYDKINRKYQCEKIRQRTLFIIWHDGDFFCKDGDPKAGEQE